MTSTSNPPTNFSISTARLNITYFDPTSPSHSAFLAHLWNTPDFIATNGKTSITDSHSVQTFIQTRIIPQYTCKGFGLLLFNFRPISNPRHENTLPIGTISLMQGDPPNRYSAPDNGFAILPDTKGENTRLRQRRRSLRGVWVLCAGEYA
ncbi:hypothetical protein AnigIFM59636_011351 [Aspergillus niger]|nr:hypothetical protein AnigIFM59636_011351 [Aspergillus niger]